MDYSFTQKAAFFKALGDQTRVQIVAELCKNTQLSCSELSEKFNLSQPALSHHFKKLLDAEVITAEKIGVQMIYRLNPVYKKVLSLLV